MLIRHGSIDSLDKDYYLVIDYEFAKQFTIEDSKKYIANYKEKYLDNNSDLNLIAIENGVVVWCYKGTPDECNNSIWYTYSLHRENEKMMPVFAPVPRNIGLKISRTLRGLLSQLSRTQYRSIVKKALQINDYGYKVNVLRQINFCEISSFNKNISDVDCYKFIAFQLIQTIELMNNFEVFIKRTASRLYPELRNFIDRKTTTKVDLEFLNNTLNSFLNSITLNFHSLDLP